MHKPPIRIFNLVGGCEIHAKFCTNLQHEQQKTKHFILLFGKLINDIHKCVLIFDV